MLVTVAAVPDHRPPGWLTRNIFNRLVRSWTPPHARDPRRIPRSRSVGRTSGEWRTTPVNLLELDDHRYLVSPRSEGERVRNLRVAGSGELRVGKDERPRGPGARRRRHGRRAAGYLRRWQAEVGVLRRRRARSTDEQGARLGRRHPVFEVLSPIRPSYTAPEREHRTSAPLPDPKAQRTARRSRRSPPDAVARRVLASRRPAGRKRGSRCRRRSVQRCDATLVALLTS